LLFCISDRKENLHKQQGHSTTMPAGSITKKSRRKYAPPVSGPPKAAVAILVRADGKILCVLPQWAVSKGKIQWEEPGGKMNPNESARECCVRETKEETGIDLSQPEYKQIGLVYSKWAKANVYVYSTSGMPEGEVVDTKEINKIGWFVNVDRGQCSFRLSQSLKLAQGLIYKARCGVLEK
jgi:ADP-ribose pyrophosphatase YjhB (NUDIX family)